MPFKYYVYNDEGLDGWVELSGEKQQELADFDATATANPRRAVNGLLFAAGELSHAPERPAGYEVHAVGDQGELIRLMRFDDGEVAEVRYVQEPPPWYEIGFHGPAPLGPLYLAY